jgi:hypothetical protein
MRGPEGQEFDNVGCYLEIVPNEKLVWTGAPGPGFRPRPVTGPAAPFVVTAIIMLQPRGIATLYAALLIHGERGGPQGPPENGLSARLGAGP